MFKRKNKSENKNSEGSKKNRLYQQMSQLPVRAPKLNRTRIIMILMLSLIIIVLIMSRGGSKTSSYDTHASEVKYADQPETTVLPHQSSDGFDISGDFEQFSGFNPPADLIGYDGFDFSGFTGFPGNGISDGDIPTGMFTGGFPTDRSIDIPTINPPGDRAGLKPPDGPSIDPLDFDPKGNQNNDVGNYTAPQRKIKGRNLPAINILNFSSINLNIPGFENIELNLTAENSLFIGILFFALYLNKAIVPLIIQKLEEETGKESSIFIKPSKEELERRKKARERVKRLLVFKDHVTELITRSELRLVEKGAIPTIISGYHELDEAFDEFAKLKRLKDITPLEHARKHFETGEIDNNKLEQMVGLFYLTRYGHRLMKYEDGENFIKLLSNLVIKDFSVQDIEFISEEGN